FLRVLPQANHRLAASMALFAGALRSGDARQIISDAVTRGLERAGKRDVADKVKGDVDKLSAESTRTLGGGEWRAYAMPFVNGAAIEPIRLFVRQVGGDDERKRSGGQGDGQRFILEISMRALGRIQLDGMVRRDDKTFDLIMRTQDPLPADMRRDILAIFADNCEVCGTKGMVVFQTGRFVDLPPDTNPTALMV
ncbi:MAG TPA: DNA polymerase III, partial [Candidatus Omnitrophota bacterium]|nr:DNA polymerase III [Candidatus Omnitrophota bacterium]